MHSNVVSLHLKHYSLALGCLTSLSAAIKVVWLQHQGQGRRLALVCAPVCFARSPSNFLLSFNMTCSPFVRCFRYYIAPEVRALGVGACLCVFVSTGRRVQSCMQGLDKGRPGSAVAHGSPLLLGCAGSAQQDHNNRFRHVQFWYPGLVSAPACMCIISITGRMDCAVICCAPHPEL